MSKAMSAITYLLCGGTAINIGLAMKQHAKTLQNKHARFIGFDSSDANKSHDEFEVHHMPAPPGQSSEKARGSGKMKSTNYEQAENFIKAQVNNFIGNDYYVVVVNTSGGTGSLLWTYVVRELARLDLPFVVYFINQFTSLVEKRNVIGALRTAANQTGPDFLNQPICFLRTDNVVGKTRGEVNLEIVNRLDLLSLFMTEENAELDYTDWKHCLNYSKAGKIAPAFSEITFYDQQTIQLFNGKTPVAVASLFQDNDSVVPMFEGLVYPATGVFPPNATKPSKLTQLHMLLDHGEALKALEKEISALDTHNATASTTFVAQKSVSQNADKNGIEL